MLAREFLCQYGLVLHRLVNDEANGLDWLIVDLSQPEKIAKNHIKFRNISHSLMSPSINLQRLIINKARDTLETLGAQDIQ